MTLALRYLICVSWLSERSLRFSFIISKWQTGKRGIKIWTGLTTYRESKIVRNNIENIMNNFPESSLE